ncbi:MAG: hypothetical protein IJS52_01090 [Bacilli bacterium]|nr:hypothetical protein [Bacilli bacterium]
MNRKPLLALFGISIVAVFSLTFFASVCENTPIVPDVMATTNKSFTFDSAIGGEYWQLSKWEQSVATGQGSPISSRIELPYETYCDRGFGGGSLFYYQTNGGSGSFNFSFGINNLQSFEFSFHTWNSGWNMASAEFHAAIDYQDGDGNPVYQENYDLVNGDSVDKNSDLHANTPTAYSWTRTQEFIGEAIRKVLVNVSYAHMSRIFMDYVTVSWSC